MCDEEGALVLTFRSIHDVLGAEKHLADRGYALDLIPVPVAVSSDCGFCLRLEGGGPGLEPGLPAATLMESLRIEAVWRIVTVKAGNGRIKEKRYVREA